MKRSIVLMFTALFSMIQMLARPDLPQKIMGNWYAVSEQAPITFSLYQDGSFNLVDEAFSGMTMNGRYIINTQASPWEIDLKEMGTGMDGLGLVEVTESAMTLLVSFGPVGYVQRPKVLDETAIDLATKYFSFSRDKHILDAVDKAPAIIPDDAKLAFERNQRLGAGICLNGVVDGNSFRGSIPDMPLTDEQINAIADAGFKSVRLCTTWTKHCLSLRPYTIDPAFLKKVDDIVDRCLARGLAVSIDMHYYPYINMDDEDPFIDYEENYNRLAILWEQIATFFKDKPDDLVFFDLLNEPNIRMGADKWNEAFNSLIKLVRKTNPNRTLIISTPNLGQHWTINQLELPSDDWNLIVQVHYYLPHTFTHQGLSYARAEGTEGTLWLGTESEQKPIVADLDYCYQWSQRNGRPIYVGEYGVVEDADPDSRARYMGYLKHEMEKRGFSCHIWGLREVFGFFNPETNTFNESILKALKLNDIVVRLDLNYDTTEQLESISVKQGYALPLDKKPFPEREGYRFGGWYTSKEGKAQNEWLFGKKIGSMGAFMNLPNDSMSVEKPMALYARWIAPTHIKNAEELNRMRDDLYGWYVLDNDIDMAGMADWVQVGVYEADYEWAEGEWWKNAFKGKLDGQGHTIRNLRFSQPTSEKKALFGSMMNGELCNLVIDGCVVDMNTTSMYVAPLVGIMKQGGEQVNAITNVQVKNAKYKLILNNAKSAFSAVTFLTAGAWNGSISNCSVQGEMDITYLGTGGGQFYVGAFAGENYSEMNDCQADVNINIHFAAPHAAEDFSVFIGGLAASATNVKDCVAKGSISIDGDPLTGQLFVGGLVGSERYGETSQSTAKMQVRLNGMKQAQIGGIVGEFNKTFGGVGAVLGFKKTSVHDCHAEVDIQAHQAIRLARGAISGSGIPEPLKAWGGQMEYEVRDCTSGQSPL